MDRSRTTRSVSLRARLVWCCLLTLCPAWMVASGQTPAKPTTAPPKPGAKATAAPSTPSPAPTATPFVLPDPVAKVDGEPISRKELERTTATILQNNGRDLRTLSPSDQRRAYQSVLSDVILDKILAKKSAGEKISDTDVATAFDALVKQYPSKEAFENELKATGQNDEQIQQTIRLQLAQKRWIEQQIASEVVVTPQEVEKFYKESPPSKFDTPEMFHAKHILISVRRSATPEDAVDAENKINALADRIKKGESFESVAQSASEDPSTKANGGDLKTDFSRDRIMPEFGEAVAKLKVGEVSPPVRTQFGYHLIKLVSRKPAHTADFPEAKEQITAYLVQQKRQAAIAKLVSTLRGQAKVETSLVPES